VPEGKPVPAAGLDYDEGIAIFRRDFINQRPSWCSSDPESLRGLKDEIAWLQS